MWGPVLAQNFHYNHMVELFGDIVCVIHLSCRSLQCWIGKRSTDTCSRYLTLGLTTLKLYGSKEFSVQFSVWPNFRFSLLLYTFWYYFFTKICCDDCKKYMQELMHNSTQGCSRGRGVWEHQNFRGTKCSCCARQTKRSSETVKHKVVDVCSPSQYE